MTKTQHKPKTENTAYLPNHCRAPYPGSGCSAVHVLSGWCMWSFSFSTTGKRLPTSFLSDIPEYLFSERLIFSAVPDKLFSKKKIPSDIPESVFPKNLKLSELPDILFSKKNILSDSPENVFSRKNEAAGASRKRVYRVLPTSLSRKNQYQDAAKQILPLLTK